MNMTKTTTHKIPATGFKGLVENWRNDFIAAISVSLVALPLALGIGIASGVSPMSGIISAIIGGMVTTFVRGSHVAINGPAAGLIAVVFAAIMSLEDGTGQGLHYTFAAIVISGIFQVFFGLLKLGRFAQLIPTTVIHGILAAIGVIIFSKQIHVAMGTHTEATNTVEVLIDIFRELPHLNPFVTIISVLGLLLLAFHSKISYKFFHFLPAQIWVLALAIPFVYLFNFFEPHSIAFLGKSFEVGPDFLISVPANPLDSIIFPNFSKIGTMNFWIAVISINLISSVETLAISKAVDKLDPYKRKTDMNKDLMGLGLSTILSGLIGGLPIITVIARSTVNVHNNAKTKWSNFYHGLLLLIFVLLLAPVIQKIPLAALAVILVYTGFKLAAPRVFKHAYDQGTEQVLFMVGTLLITLFTDLLLGIIGGILLTLVVHILLARVPLSSFFQLVFNAGSQVTHLNENNYLFKVRGIANFLGMIKFNRLLAKIPEGSNVTIDISNARLVDLTVLEHIEDYKRTQINDGGSVTIKGAAQHVSSTSHPLALKSNVQPMRKKLNSRQQKFKELAEQNHWNYRPEVDWDASYLQNFQFFETRPIEQKSNVINGTYPVHNVRWEISDITFDEGALIAAEVYRTTCQVVKLPFTIPHFIIEQEDLFDKVFDSVMAFTGQKDIDFELFPKMSSKFLIKGENEEAIRTFFTPAFIRFLEDSSIYHIESNGEALLIFRYLRLARTEETSKMLEFSEELLGKIKP